MENKIIFIIAVVSMISAAAGIFGGMFLESTDFMLIGLGIWAAGLITMLSVAMWNSIT